MMGLAVVGLRLTQQRRLSRLSGDQGNDGSGGPSTIIASHSWQNPFHT